MQVLTIDPRPAGRRFWVDGEAEARFSSADLTRGFALRGGATLRQARRPGERCTSTGSTPSAPAAAPMCPGRPTTPATGRPRSSTSRSLGGRSRERTSGRCCATRAGRTRPAKGTCASTTTTTTWPTSCGGGTDAARCGRRCGAGLLPPARPSAWTASAARPRTASSTISPPASASTRRSSPRKSYYDDRVDVVGGDLGAELAVIPGAPDPAWRRSSCPASSSTRASQSGTAASGFQLEAKPGNYSPDSRYLSLGVFLRAEAGW